MIDLQANINKLNFNVSFVREPYGHIHVLRSSTLSKNTNNFIQMFPLQHIPLQNYLQDLVYLVTCYDPFLLHYIYHIYILLHIINRDLEGYTQITSLVSTQVSDDSFLNTISFAVGK